VNRERETVEKLVHIAVQFHTFFTEINPGTGASAIMINYRGFGAVKIDRHGKAKVLSAEEIQRLFTLGLTTERDRTLIGVMLYTGCRVNEAVTLKIKDVYNSKGRIRAEQS
jgi:integrase